MANAVFANVGSNSPFLPLLLSGTGRILFLVISVIKHHRQHVCCDRGKLIILMKEIEEMVVPILLQQLK